MFMPVTLTEAQIRSIENEYFYLVNYQAEDPDEPINPLTYVDSNGDHLLHIATQREDVGTVGLLLRAGVDVNMQGDMGCTALHYAMQKRSDDLIKLLLANGASSNIENDFGQMPTVG